MRIPLSLESSLLVVLPGLNPPRLKRRCRFLVILLSDNWPMPYREQVVVAY